MAHSSELDSNNQQDEHCVDLRAKLLKEVPIEVYCRDNAHILFLYLENNQIEELPEEFFPMLRFLRWLDVRNNLLRSIPATIANHECLETLLLKNNKLENLPLELGSVRSLRGLQLQGNPLRFPCAAVVRAGAEAVLRCLREAKERAERGPVLALPAPDAHAPQPQPPTDPPAPRGRRASTAAAGVGAVRKRRRRAASGAPAAPAAHALPHKAASLPRLVALAPPPPPPRDTDCMVYQDQIFEGSVKQTRSEDSALALQIPPSNPYKSQLSLLTRRRRTKIIENILKDLWMEKVKQNLMMQEKEVERRKSEVALKNWRRNYKRVDLTPVNYEFQAPYDIEGFGSKAVPRRRAEKIDVGTLAATLEANMSAVEGAPDEQHMALARRVEVLTELQKQLQSLRLKSTAYHSDNKKVITDRRKFGPKP